ncbi:MAG TPA: serine/threonine-protein kinase, partial [Planctomycetaceae bacterium]|nr:serine/threonine-protein kinase [Planctomycetaceae bacterium]
MIKRPANNDDDPDSPNRSQLFCSLLLEIDNAVSQGASADLHEASLAGLSFGEADRLREARRCLELLYNSRRGNRPGEKGLKSTLLFDVGNPPLAPGAECAEVDPQAVPISLEIHAGTEGLRLGRFEVVRELGRGGQGIVFLARDPRLNRLIALKVPRPEFLMSAVMRRRFVMEGHAAAILTHPNVVTVLEAGQIGPVCYLAQTYVAGPTLADWQKQQPGPISPCMAAAIMAQLADGVEYAHARGVLHRDLKPSNVLLDGAPFSDNDRPAPLTVAGELPFVPRITDFGVARMLEAEGQETVTGTILGTAAYMSPEQAGGRFREMDGTTDVYSLGAILYELLTDVPVFQGDTVLDTLRRVMTVEPTPPCKLRPDLPRDLEAICLKCLEKDPKARYASAFELAADLRRFLSHEPTRVRPLNGAERLARWCRRKPALAGLTGLLATALFALLGHILWSHSRLQQLVIESNEGRQRAEYHERLADQNKEWALRRERTAETMAYAADLRLVAESWETTCAPAITALLQAHVPSEGRPDLRGFEWWFYHNLLCCDTPSKEMGTHQGGVQSTVVSPRGDLAASGGSDGVVRLWNLAMGSPAGELRGHAKDDISGLAFSPDGSLLASAGDDRTVRVWDVRQRKQLWCLVGHTDWVSTVTFLGDNATLASAGADRTILV